jgi:hypothetical protein
MENLKQPEASSTPSTTTSGAQLKKLTVLHGMKILFSAYRLDQFTDPEGFKLNIGLMLEQYPIDTIRFVTDPRTGVQRHCAFPPSVKLPPISREASCPSLNAYRPSFHSLQSSAPPVRSARVELGLKASS